MHDEDSNDDDALPVFNDGRTLELPQASGEDESSSDDVMELPELANATKDWIRKNGWATEDQIDQLYDSSFRGSVMDVLRASELFDKEQLQELEEVERLTDTLPEFSLEKRLGAGAVGAVYRAMHRESQTRVALKFLHEHIDGNDEHRERFEREAATLAQLNHPVIPRLIDHSQAREAGDFWMTGRIYELPPYLAMEYVEGMTLKELIKQAGAVPEKYALWAAEQVARALNHATDVAGIIHRDIKPDNIIIEKPRDVPVSELYEKNFPIRIIDFGLAKIGVGEGDKRVATEAYTRPGSGGHSSTGSSGHQAAGGSSGHPEVDGDGLTLVGTVLGTPRYMAPEQVMGEELDWRADLYALGATLYHLLTGEPPYTGNSPADVMMRHVRDPIPDPRDVVPAVSDRAARISMRAMEKKKERRYKTYLDFAEACERGVQMINEKSDFKLLSRPYKPGEHGTGRHTNKHKRKIQTEVHTRGGGSSSMIPAKSDQDDPFDDDEALEPKTGYIPNPVTRARGSDGSTTIVTQRLTKAIQAKVRGELDPFDVPSLDRQRGEQERSTTYLLRYQPEKEETTDAKPWLVLGLSAAIFVGAIIFRYVL